VETGVAVAHDTSPQVSFDWADDDDGRIHERVSHFCKSHAVLPLGMKTVGNGIYSVISFFFDCE
jgi:hypothetical protein